MLIRIKQIIRIVTCLCITFSNFWLSAYSFACDSELLNHDVQKLASQEKINLCDAYYGRVILVVNTASKCGNTPQYEGLEKLYQQYRQNGLVVLGFPSNDFFGQEPGSEHEIQQFCRLTYGIKFPMFEKITVKQQNAHPFYHALAKASGTYPDWNFHKYLIGRDGRLISSFGPGTQPDNARLVQQVITELNL